MGGKNNRPIPRIAKEGAWQEADHVDARLVNLLLKEKSKMKYYNRCLKKLISFVGCAIPDPSFVIIKAGN